MTVSSLGRRQSKRRLLAERLESRHLMAGGDVLGLHNDQLPADVNVDGHVSTLDALVVVNYLQRFNGVDEATTLAETEADATSQSMVDVDNNGHVSALDALVVINHLNRMGIGESAAVAELPTADFANIAKAAQVDSDGVFQAANDEFFASLNAAESLGDQNLLEASDVETLLKRASMATSSTDAIIAVVDRNGKILGVRVEDGVNSDLQNDPEQLAFAIDGAVAKARTAAFFSSNAAPLTSRTVRFISQSTVTQREVESSPISDDPAYRGPGFVAPIGVGGHFPPEVNFAPQVDLFAIEHQSRDSQLHAGADGTTESFVDDAGIHIEGDDFALGSRFNADPAYVPRNADEFFQTWPESYGVATETFLDSQSRGVATLPGGIPLYKAVTNPNGSTPNVPLSESFNLVGGIGVFFPGEDGYATYEQGFQHASERGGVAQTEKERTNASKVLEAEFTALIAAAGTGLVGPSAFVRDLSEFNNALPSLPDFFLPTGRIDLVGITLEIYGPHPDQSFRQPGIDRLINVGRSFARGSDSGENKVVNADGDTLLVGQAVPEGWLVAPHDSAVDTELTAERVEQIILTGVNEADRTRAAIRLDIDNNFRPGAKTRMVLAVADTNGELLGLYRMPDATVFSIDVSIAKARNTAYYADADALQAVDRIDFNGDDMFGPITQSLENSSGDTVPLGTALTNRTFRFIVEPRYPTGSNVDPSLAGGLQNDPTADLCDQKPGQCQQIAPHSILRTAGINPVTAENVVNDQPLDFDVYGRATTDSFLAFDAFNPSRNFRDPGDAVIVAGSDEVQPLANQNGVVFFPGSSPLYIGDSRTTLVGGFGVSGDGVDQDDVVTFAGQQGFDPNASIRVDQYVVGGVRLPFQKFNRNPFAS
ncbi:hypothetical protein RMSM_03068 [Rhodopirellula maiorica SM1]|uniref:Dockerin domain-containing protein n=1 Tax=Rhodopirellula maiorica SM1 TaxID=1265738 RepID=M5RL04_9BACT|nr:dockerin type I domain-containing protein [Rhodopirellula maiorica]EMI20008.1 hypothetical protein RMSM_03068 [Rhodopirellula maiorica SM1]